MRFMMMVRSGPAAADAKPSPEYMDAIREYAAKEMKAGVMVARGRLFPEGAQLKLGNGKVEVLDGPFSETKEVIGGIAIYEFPDLTAATAHARAFLEINARHFPGWEGTIELRPIAAEMFKDGETQAL